MNMLRYGLVLVLCVGIASGYSDGLENREEPQEETDTDDELVLLKWRLTSSSRREKLRALARFDVLQSKAAPLTPFLIDLHRDSDGEELQERIEAAIRCIGWRAIPHILSEMKRSKPTRQEQLLQLASRIYRANCDPSLIPKIGHYALHGKTKQVKLAAIDVLYATDSPEVIPIMCDLSRKTTDVDILHAITTLFYAWSEYARDDKSATVLRDFVVSRKDRIRRFACAALVEINSTHSRRRLIEILSSDKTSDGAKIDVLLAMFRLREHQKEFVPTLLTNLYHNKPEIQNSSLSLLKQFNGKSGKLVDTVLGMTKDSDSKIRVQACLVLSHLQPGHRAILPNLLRETRHPKAAARWQGYRALLILGLESKQVQAAILRGIDDPSSDVELLCIRRLGWRGDESHFALSRLEEKLEDSDGELRKTLEEAISIIRRELRSRR